MDLANAVRRVMSMLSARYPWNTNEVSLEHPVGSPPGLRRYEEGAKRLYSRGVRLSGSLDDEEVGEVTKV